MLSLFRGHNWPFWDSGTWFLLRCGHYSEMVFQAGLAVIDVDCGLGTSYVFIYRILSRKILLMTSRHNVMVFMLTEINSNS